MTTPSVDYLRRLAYVSEHMEALKREKAALEMRVRQEFARGITIVQDVDGDIRVVRTGTHVTVKNL
jgi:hypothetical protein